MADTNLVTAEVQAALEAIDAWYRMSQGMEMRQPGDVDAEQLAVRWGCCEETVRARMVKAVKSGAFVTVVVTNPETGRPVRVWRKAGD
jgi:predicted ArsR family transcriptional regulator